MTSSSVKKIQSQRTENSYILRQIIRAINYLAMLGVALRLRCLIPLKILQTLWAYSRAVLRDRLFIFIVQRPKKKTYTCTCISHITQNDLINIIGCDVIHYNIIGDIKEAHSFSILADEVSSHIVDLSLSRLLVVSIISIKSL